MTTSKKIRYGVVGLGHISQTAVLPAFRHALRNSTLTALVSGDLEKLDRVARKFRVRETYSYSEYDRLLGSGVVDAVYISLPNHLHHEFAKRALKKGVHVLCEKPLALKKEECQDLIKVANRMQVKLMTAYRLHFDPATLKALQFARQSIGSIRYFNSSFSFLIQDSNNIRLKNETGGGPLWDIGIYCLNTARTFFQSEPLEVMAMTEAASGDRRFQEVEETAGVLMRFPEDRIASFVCSFGAQETADFHVFGTKGSVHLENAYNYSGPRKLILKHGEQHKIFSFKKADQFAPELLYFSDCILKDKPVEPSGYEGLADVKVIEAFYESASTGRSVRISPARQGVSVSHQKYHKPATPKIGTFDFGSPSGK